MSEGIAKEREHLAEELHSLRAKNTALKDIRDSKHQHDFNSFRERMSDIDGLVLPEGGSDADENSKKFPSRHVVNCMYTII